MLSVETYALACALFFFAGFTKGVIGFGVNIISIPAMAVILGGSTGARDAIAIASIVTFLNNVLLVAQWSDTTCWPRIRRIVPFMACSVAGVIAGAFLLVALDPRLITFLLGLLTIFYVLTHRARQNWRILPHHEHVAGPAAGFATGLLGGISGVATPVLVAYLQNLRLERREFVYTISVIFIILNGSQSLSYWGLGLYRLETVLIAISFVVPVMLGTWAGGSMQSKISQLLYNRLILLMLLLTGLDLIRRTIFH